MPDWKNACRTACGRICITDRSGLVPVAETLSRPVPNSDSRLIQLIRHAQVFGDDLRASSKRDPNQISKDRQ
jgi:hypothetical protein